MGLALGILLTVAVVAVVVRPIWRPALEPVDDVAGPASELAALEERKQAIYGSIRDLGFDYRTDKLVEEDYRREAERLKAEAVEVVARIEELRGSPPRGDDEVEERIAALRGAAVPAAAAVAAGEQEEARPARFCPQCGRKTDPGDRFCAGCGHRLPGES